MNTARRISRWPEALPARPTGRSVAINEETENGAREGRGRRRVVGLRVAISDLAIDRKWLPFNSLSDFFPFRSRRSEREMLQVCRAYSAGA
jgi:hypothetical protein